MRKRKLILGCTWAIGLLLTASPAPAVITALTPLRDVLQQSTFIVTATIESVDASKPAIVLVVEEDLKGKAPTRKLPVLLKGDAEAKKKDHVALILKRVAPKLPLVLFILQQDKKYTAFAYTNGTWFQITGVETDRSVRWSFTHGEPYLRKTFKGSTAELKQVVIDGLSGKKEPPKPDTREKPGFGPEVETTKKEPNRDKCSASGRFSTSGNTFFAVIPTVLVGGPLAILALLFPAVFGGLTLVMRRWMVALTVLSLTSTFYFVQLECGRWLVDSWWGTPAALWLMMTIVTTLGILWAWRRHIAEVATASAPQYDDAFISPLAQPPARLRGIRRDVPPQFATADARKTPSRAELMTLGVLSVICLVVEALLIRNASWTQLDLGNKLMVALSAGLLVTTLHALYRQWAVTHDQANGIPLPGEGVLLCTLLLVGVGFGLGSENAATGGISAEERVIVAGDWYYRVAWRFRPRIDRCWMASSPVVEGERVYIGVVLPSAFKGSGALYCLDRRTGKEIWVFNSEGDMKDVFSSPCVVDGRVYIGEGFHQHADCKLYCLDAASGKKLWDFPTGSHTESSPCVIRGKVYFGAGDDGLYCLDAASGREIWHKTGLHVDANPLVIDNRLYGGSGIGDAYQETVLFCLNADTGDEHWRMPMDLPVWGMPAVQGEYLYAGIGNGNFLESAAKPAGAVLCLERATGRRVWRYDTSDGVHVRVAVDANSVWFASRDQHCYCLDRHSGGLRWKVNLGSPVLASPALVEHSIASSLYVITSEGILNRLNAQTGEAVWNFNVTADADQSATVFSSPFVQVRPGQQSESRLIWFGCGLSDFTHGILYCLEEKTH